MWAMIVKEFRQLRRDRRTLAMMIVMPVILLIVFGYAASFDVTTILTVAAGPQASHAAHLLGKPFEIVDVQPSQGRTWAEEQLRDGHAAVAVVTGNGQPEVLIDGSQLFTAKAAIASLAATAARAAAAAGGAATSAGSTTTPAGSGAAARARFGDLGYDRATIRGIAADAGVDAALVHHFYGAKDQLFAAAMRLPVNPREVLADALAPGSWGQDESLGEHLLRTVLGVWEVAEIRATFLGLLRSAPTSEQAVVMLREFLAEAILGPLTAAAREAAPGADGQDAGYRAALVASQVLGLGLTRYVLEVEPLVQASSEELIAAIAPNLDRYLSGDLR